MPGAVDGVAAWLGYINLILLAFNLVPALPLDGGRVLRSALWAGKDFHWATAVAADVGRAFGYLMIAGGLLLSRPGLLQRRMAGVPGLVPVRRGERRGALRCGMRWRG